jgi:hypothetical protein
LDDAASLELSVRLSKKSAKKLRLPVVVGALTKSVQAGEHSYKVRLRKRAARKLKGLRSVKLQLLVTAKDAAGNPFKKSLTVTLKR